MTSCTLWINNRTNKAMSSLAAWHTPSLPLPPDVVPERAILNHGRLAPDGIVKAEVPLAHSPLDFWLFGCRFEEDDETYALCNFAVLPYKEFAVSDGDNLHFVIKPGSLPGNFPVDVKLNGDQSATAALSNVKQILVLELVEALLKAF